MSSAAVRVALRVRPLTQKEHLENSTECLSYIPNEPQILIGTDKSFTYDYVFPSHTQQSEVYATAAAPLLEKFMDGYNATILAYGQTGSGKTYSMGTGLQNSIRPEDQGIVPRCISELFKTMHERKKQSPDYKFEIYVSFLELYNEELVDLLNPQTSQRKKGGSGSGGGVEVSIREDVAGNIYWSGVREERCHSPEELLGFLAKGSLCRTTGSTDMNTVSSRSHAIFSVILKQQRKDEDNEAENGTSEGSKTQAIKSLTSKFHFVDLAGSERLKRTNAQGDRAKEGIAINSGLLALGNVISALGDETRRATHIPYRDSKLTRLLQDSLGGNSQTLMLACVSPADSNFMETLNTLKYANRARNIKNRVVVNQDFAGNSIEINQLRAYISRLRMEIASLRAEGAGSSSTVGLAANEGEMKALRAEVARLRERIQDMSANLIQVTSERDTLLMERELNQFMQGDAESIKEFNITDKSTASESITTHPIIAKYQQKIQDLTNELEDTKDRLAFLESTKPSAMHAMMMASSSVQRPLQSGSVSLLQNSSSTTQRRRKSKRKVHQSPHSSSTTVTVHHAKTVSKHSARRPVLSRSSSLRTQRIGKPTKKVVKALNPSTDSIAEIEESIRKEVQESIAKARAEIQKGMEVLDLVKPLDDAAKDWEEELKAFEAHEKKMYSESRDLQRTASDEGNFTPAHSPVEDDLLSNDLLDEIETLAVPSWDDPISSDIAVDNENTSSSSVEHGSDASNSVAQKNTQRMLATEISKRNPQLARMLCQIQSDIRVKEELVSHLEKSETEYAFMRRKFDERISQLQEQLMKIQQERDEALARTKARMTSKSEITVQMKDKQQLIDIRHSYEAKMKNLLSEIQELKRKYSQLTMTMQATRNQNEALQRNLKANVETLKMEKKRMIKRMKQEAERVRAQAMLQEKKIQQLQRLNMEANVARKRLERQNEQQTQALKKRDEEVLMNNNQLKQLTNVLKKAVREGGVLDERLLSKVSHIVGGSFAIIARGKGRRSGRKKANSVPAHIRIARKKNLLDNALYQYIQGKQAVVEMEQLLVRREQLAAEKLELLEERRHIYLAEKECAEATGQPMDTMALDFTDERIDLISAEVSYLSARIRALQSEAAGDVLASEAASVAMSSVPSQQRSEKRVAFADDIVDDTEQSNDDWADMDALEEQFTVPPGAAPELAYDVTMKLLKTLEYDECKGIIEALIDDIMNLRLSECNTQVTVRNLEKTVQDLRRTLIVMKRAAITTTIENEKRIRRLEDRNAALRGRGHYHSNDDVDSAIDVKIEEYINSGNTIFDKIYEDGIRGIVSTPEPSVEYPVSSRRSSIASFGGSGSEDALMPPPSPLATPIYVTSSPHHGNRAPASNGGVKPPVTLVDKNRRDSRDATTPSPDRFLHMIQRRLSWQHRMVNSAGGSESPIPYVMANPAEFARYASDRDSSSASSLRSNHIRRSSMQSDNSSSQQSSNGSLRKRAYSLQQPVLNRRRGSIRGIPTGFSGMEEPNSPVATASNLLYQQQRYHVSSAPLPRPHLGPSSIPSTSTAMERSHSGGGHNVFDRLAQTPTRASQARMASHRYSSGSVEDLRQRWEMERIPSALSGTYYGPQ